MRLAVPRPKWNSSVPWNSPIRVGCIDAGGTDGVAIGPVIADGAGETTGAEGAGVEMGSGSSSEVRMNNGDPRYQPRGPPIASTTAASAALRAGWRRAAANQPRRRAT